MLKFFEIERTFHDTTVRLYVEPLKRSAELTVTYERRIVARQTLGTDQHGAKFGREQWFDLREPSQADSFLSRDMGEEGDFIETMEWRGKHGLFIQAA